MTSTLPPGEWVRDEVRGRQVPPRWEMLLQVGWGEADQGTGLLVALQATESVGRLMIQTMHVSVEHRAHLPPGEQKDSRIRTTQMGDLDVIVPYEEEIVEQVEDPAGVVHSEILFPVTETVWGE